MTRKVIHVALNGVTGRMGYRQHLVRSLLSIREQGGVRLEDGTTVYPEPILVGRNEERLRAIAERHGLERWTTSLDEVLADPGSTSTSTPRSPARARPALLKAIEAGKHVLHREAGGRVAGGRARGWPAPPRPPGSPTAWCTTSCSCPA